MKKIFTFFAFVFYSLLINSQNPLSDPGIKSGEVLTYTVTVGQDISKLEVKTDIKTIEGQSFYLMKTIDKNEEVEMLFRKVDFQLTSIHVNQKQNNSKVERQIVLKEEKKLKGNEIGLLDFRGLMYALRAVPFKNMEELYIHVYATENNFPTSIKYVGEEKLIVDGISMNCYKIQLNIDGFWGKLFPKLTYWYNVAQPHYLVRYEGSSGGPGTPKRVIELVKISN